MTDKPWEPTEPPIPGENGTVGVNLSARMTKRLNAIDPDPNIAIDTVIRNAKYTDLLKRQRENRYAIAESKIGLGVLNKLAVVNETVSRRTPKSDAPAVFRPDDPVAYRRILKEHLRNDGLVGGPMGMAFLPPPDQPPPEFSGRFFRWLMEPFKLESPQHSVMHQAINGLGLHAGVVDGRGMLVRKDLEAPPVHSLLVQHDWASLFGHSLQSGPDEGTPELVMPYPNCCFEFQISGARVNCLTASNEAHTSMTMSFRIGKDWASDRTVTQITATGWKYLRGEGLVSRGQPKVNARFAELINLVTAQIRAVAIMLEAEVAIAEVTRAPYKRNEPAGDHAPLPTLSHHIVSLARRHERADRLPTPAGAFEHYTRKRLHFRRSHWRHFASHKTKIPWTLVGDPDLGFVEKEYRL